MRLFGSYLMNRQRFVSIRGLNFKMLQISLGVPKGCSCILSSFLSQLMIHTVILIQKLFHMQMTQPCGSLIRMKRYFCSLFRLLRRRLLIGSPLINYLLTLKNPHQLILGLSQKTQTHSVKLLGMDIDSKLNCHDS